MKKRKRSILAGAVVALLVGGVWGYTTLKGASANIDPSRLATVERGTMVRSVVATGKVEPITKVEIKSKANGIIEALHVDVDSVVKPGDVLVELDKETACAHALREAPKPTCRPRAAALEAAEAQLQEERRRGRRRRTSSSRAATYERAQSLFEQKLVAQSALDDAHSALDLAENRKRAAQSQLVDQPGARSPRRARRSRRRRPRSSAPTRSSPTPPSARRSAAPC